MNITIEEKIIFQPSVEMPKDHVNINNTELIKVSTKAEIIADDATSEQTVKITPKDSTEVFIDMNTKTGIALTTKVEIIPEATISVNSGISITDEQRVELEAVISEQIKASSKFVPPINDIKVVVSDLAFMKVGLTKEFIQNMKAMSAAGFGNWLPFREGEYYYQAALFKFDMTNDSGASITDIKMLNHKITCDVPDIVELGTSLVAGTELGTRVYFKKDFHVIPTVVVTALNVGEPCSPDIVEVTQQWFRVVLRRHNDKPVAGQISYTAQGY